MTLFTPTNGSAVPLYKYRYIIYCSVRSPYYIGTLQTLHIQVTLDTNMSLCITFFFYPVKDTGDVMTLTDMFNFSPRRENCRQKLIRGQISV